MKLGHTYCSCQCKYDACVYCGSLNHKRDNCPMRGCYFCKDVGNHMYGRCLTIQKKRDDISHLKKLKLCDLCGIFGHELDRCFIVPSTAAKTSNSEVICIRCDSADCPGNCIGVSKWEFLDWGDPDSEADELADRLI